MQLLLEMQSRANAAGQCPPPSSADSSVASALATLNQAIEIDALRSNSMTSYASNMTHVNANSSPTASENLSRIIRAQKSASLTQMPTASSSKQPSFSSSSVRVGRSASLHSILPSPTTNLVPSILPNPVKPSVQSISLVNGSLVSNNRTQPQPLIVIMPSNSKDGVINVIQMPKIGLPVIATSSNCAVSKSPDVTTTAVQTPIKTTSKRRYVTILQKPVTSECNTHTQSIASSSSVLTASSANTFSLLSSAPSLVSSTFVNSAPSSAPSSATVVPPKRCKEAELVSQGFEVIFKKINDDLAVLKANAVRDSDVSEPNSDAYWHCFKTRFNEIVRDVIHFAKKIPTFSTLELQDQVNLIKGGCFEVSFFTLK